MTGAGRRTIRTLNPRDVMRLPELVEMLEDRRLDEGLRALVMVLYLTGCRLGEVVGFARPKTERRVRGLDGRVHRRVYEAYYWPGLRGDQFSFDEPRNGEDWMIVEGLPVEKKKKVVFRKAVVRMTHAFVPPVREFVEADAEQDKPLFRKWSESKWQRLLRHQLPGLWFHYIRSARITNLLRLKTPVDRISKMLDVDIRVIMRTYGRMLDEEAWLSAPPEKLV